MNLVFDPVEAVVALERSGYYHCALDTPDSLLGPFAAQHGLVVEGGEFTKTLKPSGTTKSSPEYWEEIRKQNEDKRIRAAAARKRKET